MMVRITVGLVALSLAIASLGCSKKPDECNALIDVVNKGIATNSANPMDDAEGIKKAAETYSAQAADLSKVQLTLPELKKISGDLQKSSGEVSSAAHSLAAAQEKEQAETAVAGVKKSVDGYKKSVDELKTFCGVESK